MIDRESAAQKIIGYRFKNAQLLQEALTHASYNVGGHKRSGDYQKLEYLGDALLNFVVAEQLYHRYPDFKEGELTKARANVVSRKPLANAIVSSGLIDCMYKDGTVEIGDKIKSDLFESVTAAIYLDSGSMEEVRRFILAMLDKEIRKQGADEHNDYKSALIEYCTANGLDYAFIQDKAEGAPHELTFYFSLYINGEKIASASGGKKVAAHQECSRIACEKLKVKRK